jgi:hypothetical protein
MSLEAIVLLSSTPKDLVTESLQRKMVSQLEAKKVSVTTLYGDAPENKEIRSTLWGLPGAKRAVYPQLFTKSASGEYAFVADPEEWERLVECNELDHRLDELVETLAKKS